MKASVSAATLNAQRKLTLAGDRLGALQSGGSQRLQDTPASKRRSVIADTTCYRYVTRTAKGMRPDADGNWLPYEYQETVRVPIVKERATVTRKRTATTVIQHTVAETARLVGNNGHDYNNG